MNEFTPERVYDRYLQRGRRMHMIPLTAASVIARLPTRATIIRQAELIIGDWRYLKSIDFGGEEDELLAKLQPLEWQLAVIDFFNATATVEAVYVYREALGYAIVYDNHEECINILDKYVRGTLNRNPFNLSDLDREHMVMS